MSDLLFERVPQPSSIAYDGNVRGIFQTLHDDPVWASGRLIRAALESPYATTRKKIQILHATVELALEHMTSGIFREDRLTADFFQGIGHCALRQPQDVLTLKATDPELSRRSAQRIAAFAGGSPLLFLMLAHGGVPASLQIAALYEKHYQYPGDLQSVVYPIYLSMKKAGDTAPRLEREEIQHLAMLAQGRRIIVCDEASESGGTVGTVGTMVEFIAATLRTSQIMGVVNMDCRPRPLADEQGVRWQNFIPQHI